MLEYISASFLYSLVKDVFKGGRRKPDPIEILAIRNKWQAEIEEKLREFRKKSLGKDVIVHDIARLDQYPDTTGKKGKGISPWFRAGLMDTYHRGILLGIDWVSLVQNADTGEWRYPVDDEVGITLCLAGKVPYENIVSINWDGDDYYNKPHIFCHFTRAKGQPYEDVVFCQATEITHVPGMPPYTHYSELISRKDLAKPKR